MLSDGISRRDYLTLVGAGATVAATASNLGCSQQPTKQAGKAEQAKPVPPPDHDRRIQWWREAKFGMFIHWGLYSSTGQA